MQIRFVGATIGRPLQLPEFHADNQWFSVQKTNIEQLFNHNPAGDQWSPLQNKQKNPLFSIIKFLCRIGVNISFFLIKWVPHKNMALIWFVLKEKISLQTP